MHGCPAGKKKKKRMDERNVYLTKDLYLEYVNNSYTSVI